MAELKIVSKAKYSFAQTEAFITVRQYVILEGEDGCFVLPELRNNAKETLEAISFRLSEYDVNGNLLGERVVEQSGYSVKGGECFRLNSYVPVSKFCEKIRIDKLSANYGKITRTEDGDGVSVEYNGKAPDTMTVEEMCDKTEGKEVLKSTRSFRASLRTGLVALILVVIAFAAFACYITYFVTGQKEFRLSGVEYEIVGDGENKAVSVTGYYGRDPNVYIPEYIEGYYVNDIAPEAFKDNNRVKSLTIGGNPIICERAFENCDSLQTINFGKVMFIGEQAFYGCDSLRSVISDEVVDIGVSAFENCVGLQEVDLGNESIKIGQKAFHGCQNMLSFSLESEIDYGYSGIDLLAGCSNIQTLSIVNFNHNMPESVGNVSLHRLFDGVAPQKLESLTIKKVDEICDYFCDNMSSLKEVKIEELASAKIGKCAFKDCLSLNSLSIPVAITSIGDNGFNGTSIPSFDCSQLTQIGEYAFANNSALNAIALEEEITSIPNGLFANCTSLASFTLPASCKEIGNSAFAGCKSLDGIVIGESVKKLGNLSFAGCQSLTKLAVPQTVEYIGSGVLADCTSLEELQVPYMGNSLDKPDCFYIFFTENAAGGSVVPLSLKKVVIDGGTTVDKAFAGCAGIEQITINNNADSFGESVFNGCISLINLYLSNNVLKIGTACFKNCQSLTSLDLISNLTDISDYAFQNCYKLAALTLNSNLKTIGKESFANCTSLTAVTLNDKIESVGLGAFSGCSALTFMQVPFTGNTKTQNTHLSYVFGAFDYSDTAIYAPSSLKSVTLTGDTVSNTAFFQLNNVEEIKLNGNVTHIGDNAFNGCAKLTKLELPTALESIGLYAFSGCASLTSVTLPDSVQTVNRGAFYGCSALKEITIPFVGYTRLSNTYLAYMFGSTSYRGTEYVPKTLKSVTVTGTGNVGQSAFYGLQSLENVVLNDGIERIGDSAFYGCRNISNVTLPSMLRQIGYQAFYNCSSLKLLELPSTLNSIGTEAFYNCYDLLEVHNYSTLSIVKGSRNYGYVAYYSIAVVGTPERFERIDADGYEFTLAEGKWYMTDYTDSASDLKLPSSFDNAGRKINSYGLAPYLFYSDIVIQSVSMPYGVTDIGVYAFNGCNSLKSVSIPSTVQGIGEYAFANCSTLTKVSIDPNSTMTSIEAGLFYLCYALESVNIPDTVEYIGDYAFHSCNKLELIVLPSRLVRIGNGAFINCENLYEVYNPGTLNIVEGATSHGYVAYYAYVVHKSLSEEPMAKVEVDGFKFICPYGNWHLLSYDGMGGDIELGVFNADGYTVDSYVVHSDAFEYTDNITSLKIGSAVKEIENNTFAFQHNLQTVEFASDCAIKSIANETFRNCYSLNKLVLSDGIETIGDYAFSECSKLCEVVMPKNLTTIGNYAFNYCSELRSVTLYDKVTAINTYAFNGCEKLFEVYNLSSLPLTKGSTNYGRIAYYAVKIHKSADEEPIKYAYTDGFNFMKLDGVWYLYRADYGYNKLPDCITDDGAVIADTYKIYDYAFDSYYNNYTLIIPKSVVGISQNAFSNSYNLTAVYYGGTKEEWEALVGSNYIDNLSGSAVYYYADCVHESGYWSYNDYGKVTTQVKDFYWSIEKQPTCTETGTEKGVCYDCGKEVYIDIAVNPDAHSFDNNNVCIHCHKEKITKAVLLEDIDGVISIANDANNPFEKAKDGDYIISGLKQVDTASITATVGRSLTYTADFKFNSSYGAYVEVYLNGSRYHRIIGDTVVTLTCSEGDIIEIKYVIYSYNSEDNGTLAIKSGVAYLTDVERGIGGANEA